MFLNTILVLVLLLLLILPYRQPKDSFTEDPLLVIRVTRSPWDINITNPPRSHVLKDIDHITHDIACADCNATIMSAYEMYTSALRRKLLAVLPSEKTLVFIKHRNFLVDETMNDVFRTSKAIGYKDETQKNIITAIAASMGYNNVNLVKGGDVEPYVTCYFETIEEDPISLNGSFPQVLDLGAFSADILRALIPFALIRNKDFSAYVEGYQERYSIKTCISFHNVIVGDESFDDAKFAPHITELRRKLKVGPELLEYYNMLATRAVENFLDVFEPQHNVHGFYNSHDKTFHIKSHEIEGLPVAKLVHVQLTKQEKPVENGLYRAVDDGRILQRLSDPDPIHDDPAAYVCVGHPMLVNKEQCIRAGGVWDRPCVTNEECPFYQANTTYRNYRGGCIDGSCEMPLGVERIAFRQYKKNNVICNGCPIGNPFCCAQQLRPAYAFPLDYFERTT